MIGQRPDFIGRGTVIQARLPKRGHEEGGDRPAVVVSAEAMTAGSTIIIIPCTTVPQQRRPYNVVLEPEETGLPFTSTALINHIRVLDKAFILDRRRGLLIPVAMARIDRALIDVLDLAAA